MTRHLYKVYLAERPDGVRYVGCTREAPEKRIRCRYHPLRADLGRYAVWAPEDLEITVLLSTTSPRAASEYEALMIGDLRCVGPMGANKNAKGGYPKLGRGGKLAA